MDFGFRRSWNRARGRTLATVEVIDAEFPVVTDALGEGAAELRVEGHEPIQPITAEDEPGSTENRETGKGGSRRTGPSGTPEAPRLEPRDATVELRTWGWLARNRRAFAQANHLIEHALRHFPFAGYGHVNYFLMSQDGHGVAIRVETHTFMRDIVHYDGVERFGEQLPAGVLQDIFAFGGETHNDLRLPVVNELGQDVCGRLELD